MMMITEITYDQISEFWLREDMWGSKLYAGHTSENLYYDGVKYFGGVDKRQKNTGWSKPVYYGVSVNEEIVGVNSYYKSTEKCVRSRGLYVLPDYRSIGVSTYLLEYAIQQNEGQGYEYIWSMPRDTALKAYERAGFYVEYPDMIPLEHAPGLNSLIHPVYFVRYDY